MPTPLPIFASLPLGLQVLVFTLSISISSYAEKRREHVQLQLPNFVSLQDNSNTTSMNTSAAQTAAAPDTKPAEAPEPKPASLSGDNNFAYISKCEEEPINISAALQWGCEYFRDACLDQGRLILHDGRKTPGDNMCFI
jgi:hypothetical protein